MIPTIFLLFKKNSALHEKLGTIFFWGVILYLPKILRSPSFFNFQDEVLHYQVLTLLHETGNLSFTPTILQKLPVIMNYPGLELVTNSFSTITGLSLFTSAIFFVGILHLLQPIILFLIVKNISASNRVASIAAFIYACNPSYIFFNSLFSYESLGIVLFLVLTWLLSKNLTNVKRIFFYSFLLVLFALICTHPFSTYMFLFLLIIITSTQFYFRKREAKYKNIKGSFLLITLLTVTITLSWIIFTAPITITDFTQLLSQRFNSIINLFMEGSPRTLFSRSLLPNYEITINYLYFPLLFLLSVIGVWYLRREKFKNALFRAFIVYGPFLVFLSLPLVFTGAAELSYRAMPFLFVGVAPVIAYGVEKILSHKYILLKGLVVVSIVLIAIGGISFRGDESGRFSNSANFAAGPSAVTPDVIAASNWFTQHMGRYNTIMGDATVSIVFGGLGIQNVITYNAWSVFFPDTINNTVIITLISNNISYLVVDKRLTQYTSQDGFYFHVAELSINNPQGYGSTMTLPPACLEKFENNYLFKSIYENGNIIIYHFDLASARSIYISP